MREESIHDEARGALYFSERFTSVGIAEWPRLLRQAIADGDDATLACALRDPGLVVTHELRQTSKGSLRVRVPFTAAETYAEAEFNGYYIRALCVRALVAGVADLHVYRAKPVRVPRKESEALIGSTVIASVLLADLRAHRGFEPGRLGIPGGPNSGLSVKLSPESADVIATFEATVCGKAGA